MIRQTSTEAFNKLKASGKLTTRRWEVYEAIFNSGPTTTNRLKRYMRPIYGELAADSAEKRITELCEMALVTEVGSEVDSVSGCSGIIWDVTGRDEPLPLAKHERKSSYDFGYRKALLDVEGEVMRRMLLDSKDQNHVGYAGRLLVESITKKLREDLFE